ncbi:hypothetical protein, partial [Cylindrospermopsis raciborskii]|uniref:hypothetical protein n=1 Tax=Cylindrospermopsis raciborskii TaxID=77022 RepID=UPI0026EE909F
MLGRKEKTIILTGVKGDLAQQVLRNINLLYIAFSLKAPLFKGGWGGSDPIKHTPQNKNSSPQGTKGDLAQQVLRNINLLYIAFSLKAPLFKGGWGGSDPIKHTPQNKNSSPQGTKGDLAQ